MPLDNKCWIGPMLTPNVYALVIRSETESGFLAEDWSRSLKIDQSPVGQILACRKSLNRVPLRMDFKEINFSGKRGELLGRIDRQNSRFRTSKTTIIKFGLHASFVELELAKSALNEVLMIKIPFLLC
ncbi:hypothetical protein TNCV_703451 [Trichonephila clavipes]|nr:hypothetical protein TNCV_703451 [Trichonephila clavipes]